MTFGVLLVLLAAAGIHVAWNLVIKTHPMRLLIVWWALVLGGALGVPLLWPRAGFPWPVWALIAGSAAAETMYYLLLVRAYERSDFSLVYPVARGFAPALLVIWSMVFLSERNRAWGFAGIALILAGILLVGTAGSTRTGCQSALRVRALFAAMAIGASTSVYSVVDAGAVRRTDPLFYMMTVFLLTGLFMAPVVVRRYGPRMIVGQLRELPLRTLAVTVLMPLAYVLVLRSYAAAPASYVGAVREVGIVLAAVVGWRCLGESFGPARTAGSLLMAAGIALIALAG
jgi:drug/metabolite transporter (DMT)-like permease